MGAPYCLDPFYMQICARILFYLCIKNSITLTLQLHPPTFQIAQAGRRYRPKHRPRCHRPTRREERESNRVYKFNLDFMKSKIDRKINSPKSMKFHEHIESINAPQACKQGRKRIQQNLQTHYRLYGDLNLIKVNNPKSIKVYEHIESANASQA